jgi:hypothetical protein
MVLTLALTFTISFQYNSCAPPQSAYPSGHAAAKREAAW